MASNIPPPSKPSAPPMRHDRVRLIITLYRKEGMSSEDFHAYWREEHSQLFANLAVVKRNLLGYKQIHCNRDALQAIVDDGFPVADWDGLAMFDAQNLDKIREVFADKEYKEIVVPDEENFLNRSRSIAWPAQIVDIFDDPS